MEINLNCRINVRTEYQSNTEMHLCLFVLFQNAHLTSHTVQCMVGLIFTDYKEGSFMHLHVPLALDSVSVNSCHGISDYAHMHDVPHYIWSFERACAFPPPRLCLSTYGFLYVPAATALSKGHKPLPETGHFLLADRLCTVSLPMSLQA